MAKLFLVTLGILACSFVFLAIRILLKRNGTFHSEHVGQSKAMRERGIHCVQAQDKMAQASKLNISDMEK